MMMMPVMFCTEVPQWPYWMMVESTPMIPMHSLTPVPSSTMPTMPWSVGQDLATAALESSGNVDAQRHPGESKNAFAKRMMADLQAGGHRRGAALTAILQDLSQNALWLTRHQNGCRAIQEAIKESEDTCFQIALQYKNCVSSACMNMHGNHVVACIVQRIAFSRIPFIIDAICADVNRLACDKYAIRVIQRILEGKGDENVCRLVERLLSSTRTLAFHEYGHLALEHILEHGSESQREVLTKELEFVWPYLLIHESGGRVLIKLIQFGEGDEVERLGQQILSLPSQKVAEIVADKMGNMVLAELVKRQHSTLDKLEDHFQLAPPSRFGREFKKVRAETLARM